MATDPYETLGVSRTADAKTIRSTYRKLVKELHPDVRPNDPDAERQFKLATSAFDLLSDPDKRRKYDSGEITADGKPRSPFSGSGAPFSGSSSSPFQGFSGFSKSYDGSDNLFTDLFSRYRPPNTEKKVRRGRDSKSSITLSFLDSVNGVRREIEIAPGRSIEVAIPAGIRDKQIVRLKKQGHQGWSGSSGIPGDHLLEVRVETHPIFTRDENHLRMDLRVPLIDAILGAKMQAPTPSGEVALSVPPMSSSGDVLRLKGKGVQHEGKEGDLLARILVILPETPDPALAEWAKTTRDS